LKFERGKIWKFVKSANTGWSKRKRLKQNTGNVRSVCGKSIEGGLKDLRDGVILYLHQEFIGYEEMSHLWR